MLRRSSRCVLIFLKRTPENTTKKGTVSRSRADIRSQQLCVCVFFPFILDVKFVGSTSRGHTGFLIHLSSAVRTFIFLARRIQPFLSLVDREVELRKNLSYRDSNSRPNVSESYEVMSYREKKGNKKKRKKEEKKHLTVVDPEILFMFVYFLPFHSGHQVRWTYQPG